MFGCHRSVNIIVHLLKWMVFQKIYFCTFFVCFIFCLFCFAQNVPTNISQRWCLELAELTHLDGVKWTVLHPLYLFLNLVSTRAVHSFSVSTCNSYIYVLAFVFTLRKRNVYVYNRYDRPVHVHVQTWNVSHTNGVFFPD